MTTRTAKAFRAEKLEQGRQKLCRNADARIGDFQLGNPLAVETGRKCDSSRAFTALPRSFHTMTFRHELAVGVSCTITPPRTPRQKGRVDSNSRIIVIGASAGGVEALLRLAPSLADLAAPLLIVLHIGAHRSILPDLLNRNTTNRAVFAQTGMVPQPGMIYVAEPDQHLLLEAGLLRLFRGPKENHTRPAINPLFRSAALDGGPRVIGVVLTGTLDDGTAGLRAIKACGGTAVVQDPDGAAEPSMPRSALAAVAVDYVANLDAMADLLHSLASPIEEAAPVRAPEWLRIEHAISLGKSDMRGLATIGVPSRFTCPDCGGALSELHEGPTRFLCHTGHAFSLRSLASAQEQVSDEALWSGLRALQEKESILRRLAQDRAEAAPDLADTALREADKLAAFVDQMRDLVTSAPPGAPVENSDGIPVKPPMEA